MLDTYNFLNQLLFIHQIKNTDFNSINYIMELGAGIGLLASAFDEIKKKLNI